MEKIYIDIHWFDKIIFIVHLFGISYSAFPSFHFPFCISHLEFPCLHFQFAFLIFCSYFSYPNFYLHFAFLCMHFSVCISKFAFSSLHFPVCIFLFALPSLHFPVGRTLLLGKKEKEKHRQTNRQTQKHARYRISWPRGHVRNIF